MMLVTFLEQDIYKHAIIEESLILWLNSNKNCVVINTCKLTVENEEELKALENITEN